MRVAVYARFSSEVQNARSIDDQIVVCQRSAQARGWSVTQAFTDAAISGAAMANRPGLLAALAAAERGEFDVLLCEAEDRIARNLEHLAHVVNRLDYAGARLATLTTDHVKTMHVAFMGAMAQEFLANLSAKTKRGMHSNAEKGLATGSRVYGYRSQPGGAQAIVEDEAAVVREIFDRYGRGETGRAICADLNIRQIPGPRGGFWNPSTLSGDRHRGNGLLATELYVGVKVWNRIEMRKDPQSGQRISRARPPQEWKRVDVPQLRILADEPWRVVQAKRLARAVMSPQARKPLARGVFSGLIKCAACGASLTAFNSRGRLICVARREKGVAACSNGRSVPRAEVEARVLDGLRTRLLSPAYVKAYVQLYHRNWHEKQAASSAAIAPMRKRLAELTRSIERLVDRICDGMDTPQTNQRLREQEAEKAAVEASLAEAERKAPPPMVLHPNSASLFAKRVGELQAVLAVTGGKLDDPKWQAVAETIRDFVLRIDVQGEEDGTVKIEMHGTLARFMKPRENETEPRLREAVAGARYAVEQTDPGMKIAC